MPTSDASPACARGRRSRSTGALLATLALVLPMGLGGCLQAGLSGLDDELSRVREIKGIGVISATPERAVFAARGKRVVVEPAAGSCIAADSIEIAAPAAFLVLSDCAIEDDEIVLASLSPDVETITLPPAFPGIVTVSVTGSQIDEAAAGPRDAVERLRVRLKTPAGKLDLGRGGDGAAFELVELRTVGDTLYVLIDEGEDAVPALLASRFWRAFLEINERMIVATVSGFSANPVSSDVMLRKLTSQVSALRAANGASRGEAETAERRAILPTPRPVDETPTAGAPLLSPDLRLPARAGQVVDIAAAVRAGPDIPELDVVEIASATGRAPRRAPTAPARR